MYGKFFASTFTGSMCGAGPDMIALWAYILSHASKDGVVEVNAGLAAFAIGTSVESVERSMSVLLAPDPRSRNKENEGRRLVQEGEYQFRIVSHRFYRSLKDADEQREYNRVKKQESRERLNAKKTRQPDVNVGQGSQEMSMHTDADAETDAKKRNSTVESGASTTPGDVLRVFETWQQTCVYPKAKLTAKRSRLVSLRLAEGYSADDLCEAVRRVASSAWHKGENDRHMRYDTLELICRDAEHVDKYLAMGGPSRPSRPRLSKDERIALAIQAGDWDKVERIRSGIADMPTAAPRVAQEATQGLGFGLPVPEQEDAVQRRTEAGR